MSYVNILAEAPDATSKRIRVNQQGQLLAATADFPPNGSVQLDTTYATLVQADSYPAATADPTGRPGWYYSNTTPPPGTVSKINWYYFDGTTSTLTFADLNQLTCVMTCDGAPPALVGGNGLINVPYFVVYTKTGKVVIYQNQSNTIQYIKGQKVLFYYSLNAFDYPQNPELLREVACPILVSGSDVPDPTDEIAAITVHSDSAFPVESFSGVISQLGFRFNTNTVIYELTTAAAAAGDTTKITDSTGGTIKAVGGNLLTNSTLYGANGEKIEGTNPLPVSIQNVITTPAYVVLTESGTNTPLTTTSGVLNVNLTNEPIKTKIQASNGDGLDASNGALKVLNVVAPITTQTFTLANFTPTTGAIGAVSLSINSSLYQSITVFGISDHSGGSTANPKLTYQFSMDNLTYYDTPYIITLPNSTDFVDTQPLQVPYIRFKITSHALDSLTLNICLR
jgi:hypothetical protein